MLTMDKSMKTGKNNVQKYINQKLTGGGALLIL